MQEADVATIVDGPAALEALVALHRLGDCWRLRAQEKDRRDERTNAADAIAASRYRVQPGAS